MHGRSLWVPHPDNTSIRVWCARRTLGNGVRTARRWRRLADPSTTTQRRNIFFSGYCTTFTGYLTGVPKLGPVWCEIKLFFCSRPPANKGSEEIKECAHQDWDHGWTTRGSKGLCGPPVEDKGNFFEFILCYIRKTCQDSGKLLVCYVFLPVFQFRLLRRWNWFVCVLRR